MTTISTVHGARIRFSFGIESKAELDKFIDKFNDLQAYYKTVAENIQKIVKELSQELSIEIDLIHIVPFVNNLLLEKGFSEDLIKPDYYDKSVKPRLKKLFKPI